MAAYSVSNFTPTFSPNTGGIISNSFAGKVDFSTNYNAYSSAIGDIDGDGKPDLVVVNPNLISVFRNTASSGSITSSSFATKVNFTIANSALNIALGDIDGDGKLDIVVANGTVISVFRNTSSSGSISFAAKVDFTASGDAIAVAIGDIDGDGKPDIVAANNSYNTVSVFRNTGSSGSITSNSFAAKVDFPTGGSRTVSVAIGDIDGDGKPDIVAANQYSAGVYVLRTQAIMVLLPAVHLYNMLLLQLEIIQIA